jgi:hypothetical protein
LPNLILNQISVEPITQEEEVDGDYSAGENISRLFDIYRVPGKNTYEYTAKVRIDYSINSLTFSQSDFVIINI